jgi:hypothetical protein
MEQYFGFLVAIDRARSTMSLRTKVIVFGFSALAAIVGLGVDLTTLKNAVTVVASAVWGS